MSSDAYRSSSGNPGHFETTHWSVVLAAADAGDTCGRESLARLCRIYWYPLYAFVRRQGHGPHDAQDLTQGFFARLLEKNYLGDVDSAKGKFRSFLLAALKHFVCNEWARKNALKRGGGCTILPLDGDAAETRYQREPQDQSTSEKLFEKRWALTLLHEVLQRLEDEYRATGKQALFDELQSSLTGDRNAPAYAEIAARLGTTEGAVKVAAHRLRSRYRELLRDEIAQTVADPAEIDDEIRQLFAALGG
jgi:RNA polymerase sigma factor (sigma-70 family)